MTGRLACRQLVLPVPRLLPPDVADVLDHMRSNPAADWTIAEVVTVCARHGLRYMAPSGGGSHHKVSHPTQRDILTIPSARPIKPVCIRKLARFIDAIGGTHAPS